MGSSLVLMLSYPFLTTNAIFTGETEGENGEQTFGAIRRYSGALIQNVFHVV